MSRQLGDTAEAKALDSARKQLKECLAENQRLREEDTKRGAWVESYRREATEAFRERDEAMADNQRVRDALREIKEHDYLDGDECRRIAREALAGDTE